MNTVLTCMCICAAAIGGCAPVKECGEAPARIVVIAEDRKFEYVDNDVLPSDFTVKEEIEKRKINATLKDKLELVDERIRRGAEYKTALEYCFPRLVYKVDEIGRYIYSPAIEPKVVYADGKFEVTPESAGRMLDENKLYCAIYYGLKCTGSVELKAATLSVAPEKTKAELENNLVLRGSYTTDFAGSTAARAHNVLHAAQKLDGAFIDRGETLSFNAAVGARTVENGFETAKIIVDGKYVDGIGGGACQASTAFYNASLIAGLNATANSHTICPSYCPPGLDAMISNASDLIIANTTDSEVYFSVKNTDTTLTVEVYGAPNEYTVVAESVVERVIPFEETEFVDADGKYFDRTAVQGDRMLIANGKNGYESSTYLNYYKNEVLIKREKIRSSYYKPTPMIVAIKN